MTKMRFYFGIYSIFILINEFKCEETRLKEEEEDVLVLTSANFDEALKTYKYLLVQLYAPWCGYCKKLAPEYAKAAGRLKLESPEIRLAKVDATKETDLKDRFNVRIFPTLKFFINEQSIDYTGGRSSKDIVLWLKKKSGLGVTLPLSNINDLHKLRDENDIVVVGLFKSLSDSSLTHAFNNVAKSFDLLIFAISTEQIIFDELNVTGDNTVIILKKFDDDLNEQLSIDSRSISIEDQITSFIKINQLPLVVEFNQDTYRNIYNNEIKSIVYLFASKKKLDDFKRELNEFKNAAKRFKGKAIFVHVNTDISDYKPLYDLFGLKLNQTQLGILLLAANGGQVKYKPENLEITARVIGEFVQDFFDNKLKPSLISQDLPNDWNSKPVKVLVASNFNQVARDPKKTVLVEFYFPDCPHCRKLEPIYNQLAARFSSRSDEIVIAKIDVRKNDIEDIKISNVPTIKLFPKNSANIIDYKGERTLDALTKFVENHANQIREDRDEF